MTIEQLRKLLTQFDDAAEVFMYSEPSGDMFRLTDIDQTGRSVVWLNARREHVGEGK